MNADLILKIVLAYKTHRTSKLINEDIKLIKKINQILVRFEKYDKKQQHILEIVNVLRLLNNLFDIDKLYPCICELTDVKFHATILYLYKKMNECGEHQRRLQGLCDDKE